MSKSNGYHQCLDCGVHAHPDESIRVAIHQGICRYRYVCLRCAEDRKYEAAIAALTARENLRSAA